MYDAFGSGGRPDRVLRRRVHDKESRKFSPSFGVHAGLIPDPNWPPVQFPEDNVAMQRKYRRVRCELILEAEGLRRRVPGDLSQGGAMVLLAHELSTGVVTIEFSGRRAEARVLSSTPHGPMFAHHAQFLDENAGRAVWRELVSR
jgi:hypothetical protein